MSHTRVYELFKCFQSGSENVESGDFQNTEKFQNIQDVHSAFRKIHRITIHELSEEGSINYDSVQCSLTEHFGMRRVFAKFVPKLLSADQKETGFWLRLISLNVLMQ
ncbi:hypothetical protein AVEN_205483-1 [Araneus ventricosus]|uniref:Uncharacterized protein n=1 Tax=Araneus ventricosus TaxID=182803 RepID=A0A4Y2CER5_ARAVE|nr:hypothetical protein AVEN_205483-1 [Araneus ventricosus]